MRKMKQMALFVSLFLLITANAFAGEPQQVTLRASGRFFSAPIGRSANVRLVASVERHEGDRFMDVVCDGDDMSVSSRKTFEEGEEEIKNFNFGFNLLSGTYLCSATLVRVVDGKTKEFVSSVEVTVK